MSQMNKIRYIFAILILNLVTSNLLTMNKHDLEYIDVNKDCILYTLPYDILFKIFNKLLGKISKIDDIYEFCKKFDDKKLPNILKSLRLTCKLFNVSVQQHTKIFDNKLTILKEIFTKEYRSLSKEELDCQLLSILDAHYPIPIDIEKCIKLIILGANINIKDKYGSTTLIQAIHHGHTDIVRLLLLCNTGKGIIDLNIQADHGLTALIEACCRGKIEIVRLLLLCNTAKEPINLYIKYKVECVSPYGDIINDGYRDAFDVAKYYGRSDILSLLRRYSKTKNID